MKWLKNPFKREPLPDHPLAISSFDKTQGALHTLRRGMWVSLRGPSAKHGILTALSPEGMARVMFVHPVTGENEIELDIPASSVRQATYAEIPQDRRCDKTTAVRLGYKVG
jgi:hypothetical protein